MSTALDMSLDDMIKNSRGNRERNREQRGRGSRGRGGPRGSFNAGRMAAGRIPAGRMASGRIPAGRMTGGVRRGPLTSTRRTKRFPWQPDLFEDSLRAAGISGIEIGTKLYVSNLDYGVTNEDIRELFSEIGELKRYAVHFDKNGRPSGSAEVVYTRRSDAFAALKRYNNVLLDGKPMKIEIVGANAGMPISARVNVTGMHGRKKRTVVMTPGPGNAGGYAMPMVNRGPSRSSRGGNRNGRGKPRGNGSGSGRGRGRGRGGEGRKKPVEKSVDELDKELDSYHADNMQGYRLISAWMMFSNAFHHRPANLEETMMLGSFGSCVVDRNNHPTFRLHLRPSFMSYILNLPNAGNASAVPKSCGMSSEEFLPGADWCGVITGLRRDERDEYYEWRRTGVNK
ncbi:hypothetical protein ACFX13_026192 [Malus domestica]